jgi:hypothetical protein
MVWFNTLLATVFAGLMALGYLYFLTTSKQRATLQAAQAAQTANATVGATA